MKIQSVMSFKGKAVNCQPLKGLNETVIRPLPPKDKFVKSNA